MKTSHPPTLSRVRFTSFLLCCALALQFFVPAAARLSGDVKTAPSRGAATPMKPAAKRQGAARPGELLVRFRWDAPAREVDALIESKGLRRAGGLRGDSNVERLAAAPGLDADALIAELRLNPLVELVEPNFLIFADQFAPASPVGYGFRKPLGADLTAPPPATAERQARADGGAVVVALIDSGVDFTHPDLRANRWANARELNNGDDDDRDGYADDLNGWDYVAGAQASGDENGHGTAVAGIIAAAARQGAAGVTWRASLMSLRVLDAAGQGDVASAVEAIDYAVSHGAQVINCSWGTDDSSAALREAVGRAARRRVLVVSAAGNGGRDLDASPRFPAAFDPQRTLSVASTGGSDALAPWSNRGAMSVAVAAPGENVMTAKAGGGYAAVTGSSASAAIASGVAGLVKSLRPGLNAARVREVIVGGARRVAALRGAVEAGGVIDPEGVLAALSALPPGEGLNGGEENKDDAGDDGGTASGAVPATPQGAVPQTPGPPAVAPPTVSAPTTGLPDLDAARRLTGYVPRAVPPVPSTLRRCPPHNPRCNEPGDGRAKPNPTPRATPPRRASVERPGGLIASLLEPSLLVIASAALNGGRPSFDLTWTEFYERGGYALSDGPDGLTLPAPAAEAGDPGEPLIDAPTNLTVTSTSDTQVSLSWTAAAGAASYVVERRTATTGFVTLASGVTGNVYNDTAPSVARGNSYLYRVRAVDGGGLQSATSNVVLGTAFTFEDDPIIPSNDPQHRPATLVRAQHIIDLRATVNAVRRLAGLADASWTNPAPTPRVSTVMAADVNDLRVKLDEALSALGITLSSYTENPLAGAPNGTPIRKIHIDELRARSTRGAAAGGGGVVGTGTGLTAKYYNGIDFGSYALTRTDPRIDFDWGDGSPSPSVWVDQFSVRWTGMIQPPTSETYTFYAYTDDGVRVWVDGQLVIDRWVDQVPTESSGQIALTAGRLYSIRVEFYENFGGATARLSWKTPTRPKEVVPQSQLYPCWKATDQFVGDFYLAALGRQPGAGERQDWAGRIAQAQGEAQLITEARSLGDTLFNSAEYAARNPDLHQQADARQYVADLYRAFLQREPDQSGWDFWTTNTLGNGRAETLNAFGNSPEFQDKVRRLCDAAAGAAANGGTGYNFSSARFDPLNRTGGAAADPFSRNYNWSLPILSLPGRSGLDLGLTLSYNSLVWTKDGSGVTFDADYGFPGPGFRLGFPSIQPRFADPRTGRNAYLLLTSSGERVELRQTAADPTVYETADSSYLRLTEGGGLTLVSPDGTRMSYALKGGQYRCVQVKDRNGNYISVGYGASGQISTIVDTLGRTVTFHYDDFDNLSSITQPWSRELESGQMTSGETHTWATFGYTNKTLGANSALFSQLAVIGTQGGTAVPVLSQVGLGDGSYYKFEYNEWGQVWKTTHYAADSRDGAGQPNDSHVLSSTRLDLPGSDLRASSPQGDCPRFDQERVWVEHGVMDENGEVTTTYSPWSPNMASCDTTAPDGTTVTRNVYGAGWKRGITTQTEMLSGGQSKKLTTLLLEHDGADDAPYPTNPRVRKTTIEDAGRRRVTEVTEFAGFGFPKVVKEYDPNTSAVLRRTEFDYADGAAYLNQRLLGLLKERRVYDEAGALASKFSYVYDQSGSISDQGAATQHDPAYGTGFLTRGNLTAFQQWDVNHSTDISKVIEGRLAYNTNGSVVSTYVYEPTKTAQEQSVRGFDYTDNFSDGQNRNTFAYPTRLTDPDGYTESVWYNYQTGAEFKRQTPQPNTDQNVAGPTVSHYYDEAGRLTKLVNNVNGAYTEWVYAPSLTLVQSFTTVADNSLPAQNRNLRAYSAMVLDGAGRVRGMARGLPDIAGGYSGQRLLRNNMGRVEYQSNPTQMTTVNDVWTPAGDDANNGVWRYTRQEYDWKGRPTVTTNQDGTQKILDYTGCGCTGSDMVTLRDEVGRLRKTYNDLLGRPYKTEDLYTDGVTVYRTVRNDFNALDRVRAVTEQAGTNGASQTTTTEYDGYGRVWKTKAPEADAPQVFEYFNDGLRKKLTDARGASATYAYNKRGLLTSIDYSAPQGVADTPDVGFGYDAAGNRTWMTDGLGRVDYSYDALSRLEWESRQFTLVSNPNSTDHRYKLSYQYTLDGQPRNITDPFGMRIDYAYDTEGRLTGVNGNPSFNSITQYTSDMKYRAWGAYKSMSYGDGLTVQFSYNARLNPSDYDLRDAGGARQMSVSYQYYNDGRVRFVDDLREDRFDRLYQYDDFARLTKAESGYKARQAPYPGNNSQNGPYNHYYGYDAFDNLTSRTGAYWYKESGENYGATYVNNRNRNTGWLYDADGRLTQSVVQGSSGTYNNTYTYDAAGQRTDAGRYDGDGLQVKSADGLLCYVRSTVLGGKVISEVWSEAYNIYFEFGRQLKTYVYVNGEALAEQKRSYFNKPAGEEWLVWKRHDPQESSVHLNDYSTSSFNTPQLRQLAQDAQGIATEAPDYARLNQNPTYYSQSYSSYNYGGYGGYGSSSSGATGGVPGNFGTGCTLDGGSVPCSIAMEMANGGAATIDWRNPGNGLGQLASQGMLVPVTSTWTSPIDPIWVDKPIERYSFTYISGYRFVMPSEPQRTDFKRGPSTFSDGQNKLLAEAFGIINSEGCKNFINETLAKHKVGADVNSLDKLLDRASFGYYDKNKGQATDEQHAGYSGHDLGVTFQQVGELAEAFIIKGASAATTSDRRNVFLSDEVFVRMSSSIPFESWNRKADTPGYIVHELFHVAGIDKAIVDSQALTNEIRDHCHVTGTNPIVLRH